MWRKVAWQTAGDLVKHAKFGEGTIVSVEGKGAEAKLTIDFGAAGKKVLLPRFVERR
jgi:DNA helicase-2/ATP-dependent DNA helicase PcrA